MHTRRMAAVALTLAVCAAVSPALEGQQRNQALIHFGHVATGFDAAPGRHGLVVTAAREVNTAMLHANVAAGHPADLAAMQVNVRHVLHALDPSQQSQGPGLGFGVSRAADAVATHIELAAKAAGASETMRTRGANVATAARALKARAAAMAELGRRVLAAASAAEAAPLVQQLRTLALQLDTGADADNSGRIDLNEVEPGMNQLEAQVYAIFEGEKLPRVLW